MELILLEQMYAAWKRVMDWVMGTTPDSPNVTVQSSALPTGAATEAKQDDVVTELQAIKGKQDAAKGVLDNIAAKDSATSAKQDAAKTVLDTISAKVATADKQDTLISHVDGLEAATGATTDAEATGNGSVIGILKRIRTLIGDSLATLGSAIGTKANLIAGSDGTNARAIKTKSDGTVLTELTGSYVGYSTDDKSVIATSPNRGDSFIELDTKDVYFYDGSDWVVF